MERQMVTQQSFAFLCGYQHCPLSSSTTSVKSVLVQGLIDQYLFPGPPVRVQCDDAQVTREGRL